jgi:hypothetical protein
MELSLVRLDTDAKVLTWRQPMHFPDKLAVVYYHARLHRCTFPAAGMYLFTLLADGEWVAQRRLHVYTTRDET